MQLSLDRISLPPFLTGKEACRWEDCEHGREACPLPCGSVSASWIPVLARARAEDIHVVDHSLVIISRLAPVFPATIDAPNC